MRRLNEIVLVAVVLSLFLMSIASAELADYADLAVRGSSDWDEISNSANFVNQEPDPAEPGSYVEVRFKIENLGSAKATDVIFEVLPEFPFSLDPGESAIRRLGDVEARQVGNNAYIIHYKLNVDVNAVDGNNDLNLRYSQDNGKSWTRLDPFTVRVQSSDAILSVESITLSEEMSAPGSEVEMKIKVKNLANSLLKDVKVNLVLLKAVQTTTSFSYEERPFSALGSTNEKIIANLGPKAEKEINFRLVVDSDAAIGIHKIPITITYSDRLGTSYSKDIAATLKVGETPDFIVNLEASDIKKAGTKGTIDVQFINKGSSDLGFLYMRLGESNDYEILSSKEIYLGNIDSDDYDAAEFEIYVNGEAEKDIMIPVTVEFRDAFNNLYSKEHNIELKLYSEEEALKYGMVQKSNSMGIFITLLIVIVGIFGYRIIRKRRKNKK